MSIVIKKHIAERFMDWAIYQDEFRFDVKKKKNDPMMAAEKRAFDVLVKWFESQPEYIKAIAIIGACPCGIAKIAVPDSIDSGATFQCMDGHDIVFDVASPEIRSEILRRTND